MKAIAKIVLFGRIADHFSHKYRHLRFINSFTGQMLRNYRFKVPASQIFDLGYYQRDNDFEKYVT